MGLFNRKGKVVDLTEHYRRQQEKLDAIRAEQTMPAPQQETESVAPFPFFANTDNSSYGSNNSSSSYSDTEEGEEKRRRLAKRLQDMTERMEDLSNQIYHLQQRLELIERKMNLGGGY